MRIKTSKRGLTFSFTEKGDVFRAGAHYRYFIDTARNEIVIVPDEHGKYKISQKGPHKKPLFDLRNEEIREAIRDATYLEVEICDEKIVVHIYHLDRIETEGLSDRELAEHLDTKECEELVVTKEQLEDLQSDEIGQMLKSAGLFSEPVRSDLSYVFDTVSLFSGAGLLDYPFSQDNSFDLRYAIDFDRYACETYRYNIGNHIVCGDIRTVDAGEIPAAELIIGGPCCQGYSNANRGNITTKTAEEKRLLIDDYIRIIKEKNPYLFVIENVPQFVTKEQGKYLNRVLTELSDYTVTYQIVKDHELGGYTTRKRMVLIGSRIGRVEIPNVELRTQKTAGMALKKVDSSWPNYTDVTHPSEATIRKMAQVKPGHNYKDIAEMSHLDRHSNTYRRLSADEPAIALVNWRKVNIMPPIGNRILSVAEAAALSGLDKTFRFFGNLNARQQQVGNGVTQAIARMVKTVVKNALYAHCNNVIFG